MRSGPINFNSLMCRNVKKITKYGIINIKNILYRNLSASEFNFLKIVILKNYISTSNYECQDYIKKLFKNEDILLYFVT